MRRCRYLARRRLSQQCSGLAKLFASKYHKQYPISIHFGRMRPYRQFFWGWVINLTRDAVQSLHQRSNPRVPYQLSQAHTIARQLCAAGGTRADKWRLAELRGVLQMNVPSYWWRRMNDRKGN